MPKKKAKRKKKSLQARVAAPSAEEKRLRKKSDKALTKAERGKVGPMESIRLVNEGEVADVKAEKLKRAKTKRFPVVKEARTGESMKAHAKKKRKKTKKESVQSRVARSKTATAKTKDAAITGETMKLHPKIKKAEKKTGAAAAKSYKRGIWPVTSGKAYEKFEQAEREEKALRSEAESLTKRKKAKRKKAKPKGLRPGTSNPY